jgi:hypothetical protein
MPINLATDDRLHHSTFLDVWRFEVGDEANTIIYSDTLHEIRQFVDWLDATGRLPPMKHTSAT